MLRFKGIKLLLVVTGMPDVNGNGGSNFNLVYLNALIKKGIQVTVVHLRSISLKRKLYEDIDIGGVKRITVACYTPPLGPIIGVHFLPSLFRCLLKKRQLNYNIIHGVGGGTVIASRIMSDLGKVPFLLQFIGSDVNVNLDKDLMNKKYIESIGKAAFIGFNSKRLESDFNFKSKLSVPSQAIYRGVNLSEFEFHFPNTRELRILFLGGVPNYNEKGAFTMAEVCNKIMNCPISKYRVSIKLGGPNIHKVLSDVKQFENENLNIQVLGAIDHDEVKRQMKISNIVIIPSVSEGMPNVLFEAMATGNIIIASEVGGIPELIQHGVTGFLIKNQSADEIISVLKNIDNNPTRSKIAMLARKLVENFSYDNFLMSYIKIYNQNLSLLL